MYKRQDVELAKTFLHETLHAEFVHQILGYSSRNLPRTEVIRLLESKLLKDYDLKYPDQYNKPQHEKIASYYVIPMAIALAQFDNDYNNYQNDLEDYESLVWKGLQDSESWLHMNYVQKDLIKSRWLKFQ